MNVTAIIAALISFLLSVLGLGPAPHTTGVPHLSHVFVVVEENTSFEDIFGAKAAEAPYLNGLADLHVRHDAYYGISHVSLGNYIGMVSGQMPSALDHADCPVYTACLRNGPTIGAQLDGASLSWKAYMDGMPAPCTRPTGAQDTFQNGYATRHNPFVYFNEIVNNPAYCAAHDVPYDAAAFAAEVNAGPPNLSFIVPDTCNDGHDSNCNTSGRTPIQNIDAWLSGNLTPILNYVSSHADSALFITFDESVNQDTAGCCNQPPLGIGGGHVGLVMISQAERGSGVRVTTPANHYSLLRTIEASFGLAPLADAAKVDVMDGLFAP